jgi:hypothetical protein
LAMKPRFRFNWCPRIQERGSITKVTHFPEACIPHDIYELERAFALL